MGPLLAVQPAVFPGWAGVFAIYFPDDVVDGRRVVFEVADPKVVAATRGGRRAASLIVPPRTSPAAATPPDSRR